MSGLMFCFTLCMLGNFNCFFVDQFFRKILSGIPSINSLDPDQARRYVGPDLVRNCSQRLSAVNTSGQGVNTLHSG